MFTSHFGRTSTLAAVALAAALSSACDTSKTAAMQRVAEGVSYFSNGDPLEGVRRLEMAIGLDPTNAQAHYFLGLIRLQHYRNPGAAATSLERAIELMPDDAEARYQLGVALWELGRKDAAAERFEEAIALRSDHAGALYRMGVWAEEQGRVRDAIDRHTRAIYADPYFPLAYNALGNIYFQFGRPQEAMLVFQNAIANVPPDFSEFRMGNAMNRADLGRVYVDVGEIDLAIATLRDAGQFDNNSASIPFNLGVALRSRFEQSGSAEDREAAVQALTRARQQCDPTREQARCNSIAATLADLRAAAR